MHDSDDRLFADGIRLHTRRRLWEVAHRGDVGIPRVLEGGDVTEQLN
ncbi:MAG: hypothetical protein GKR96_03690 [Gammaproteobacteria bacterium]|nr:hypothetical protein [Gammaproteobacteria bacterium]